MKQGKTVIEMKLNEEVTFPQYLIDDAPIQGDFEPYATEILQEFDVQISLEESIEFLSGFGAWDKKELQDLEVNKARILWIGLLDCRESGTNQYYLGV